MYLLSHILLLIKLLCSLYISTTLNGSWTFIIFLYQMKLCFLRFHRLVTFWFIYIRFFCRFNFEELWFVWKLAVLRWFNYFVDLFFSFSIKWTFSFAIFEVIISALLHLGARKLFLLIHLLLINILLWIISSRTPCTLILLIHICQYLHCGSH